MCVCVCLFVCLSVCLDAGFRIDRVSGMVEVELWICRLIDLTV